MLDLSAGADCSAVWLAGRGEVPFPLYDIDIVPVKYNLTALHIGGREEATRTLSLSEAVNYCTASAL